MNNYEKIKAMSIDEMAEYIIKNCYDLAGLIFMQKEDIKQWLQQESEEQDDRIKGKSSHGKYNR